MPAVPIQTVIVTGLVTLDVARGLGSLPLLAGESDLFLGLSGNYTGLTLQVQGSRTGNTWYDIAAYTTDDVGPLASPLSPADGASIAYKGDVRAFTKIQVNVLSIGSGSVSVEVLTGSFFPQRVGASLSGAIAQLVYETRAMRSVLSGWLGFPQSQLPNLPGAAVGTGVGGSFPR